MPLTEQSVVFSLLSASAQEVTSDDVGRRVTVTTALLMMTCLHSSASV